MPSIGIIANPASGKDIRRLVSFATVIDNNEKVNIVKRIILAAQALGVDEVCFMPDTYQMGYTAEHQLRQVENLEARVAVLDMFVEASAEDSTKAAEIMEEHGVGCICVLGGDGTSRAVAKGVHEVPIIPLSTGTNNVYPRMLEGTVAGMAAAAIAQLPNPRSACIHDKRIEVWLNGEFCDLALIDAVISDDTYVGSRAIWNPDAIRRIVVTRCHPASIGFSNVAGNVTIIKDSDEGGFSLCLAKAGRKVRAAIAAGVLTDVQVTDERRLQDGEWLDIEAGQPGMIALDGEREVKVRAGDRLRFRICRNGPWRVLPELAITMAIPGLEAAV
jgi:hypothetical protein